MSDRTVRYGQFWLSQRPNSAQWCRTWYDAGKRQTCRASLGTDDFEEADRRLAAWFVENRTASNERPADVPIESVMHRHFALHGKTLASAKAVETSLAWWTSYFEGATVADVTPKMIDAFIAKLRLMGKSNGYIRRILADGRAAFNGALNRGELTHAPRISLKAAPEPEPRERILSVLEMAALLDKAFSPPHLRTYLLLAIGTMARPEAITDLTSWSIDWQSGTINLLPRGRRQNKKRRPVVPIVQTLRPMLRALPPGPLVAFNGRPLASVRTSFEKAVKAAGLAGTGVNRYTIRHTIISEAMKRCPLPWQVEQFAGHRTGHKTTQRYVKFSPGFLGEAATAIDHYFAELQAAMATDLLGHIPASAFELRASIAGKLVEPSGIEPLTSTLPV